MEVLPTADNVLNHLFRAAIVVSQGDRRLQELRLDDGAALPDSDVPAGLVDTDARSFLVYPNYDAILRYNCAHYYALTVALLSDQIR